MCPYKHLRNLHCWQRSKSLWQFCQSSRLRASLNSADMCQVSISACLQNDAEQCWPCSFVANVRLCCYMHTCAATATEDGDTGALQDLQSTRVTCMKRCISNSKLPGGLVPIIVSDGSCVHSRLSCQIRQVLHQSPHRHLNKENIKTSWQNLMSSESLNGVFTEMKWTVVLQHELNMHSNFDWGLLHDVTIFTSSKDHVGKWISDIPDLNFEYPLLPQLWQPEQLLSQGNAECLSGLSGDNACCQHVNRMHDCCNHKPWHMTL